MQRKLLLLALLPAMMIGMNCFASKIIYSAGVSGKNISFKFPAECVGHKATIWAIGFKRGENITVTLTLKNPAGVTISTATSHYNNKYSNNSKTEQAILNFTFTAAAGSYSLALGGGSESENVAQISNTLVICWGCPGEDITTIRTELITEVNDLRGELEGVVNTKMAELQGQVSSLQTQLNDAIARHNADQAELLRQIEDLQHKIAALETDLLAKIAVLEQQSSNYLAQLEALKTAHNKDVTALNKRIDDLEAKYGMELAAIQETIAGLAGQITVLEREYSSGSEDVRTVISALEKQQTELQHQFALSEQQHRNDLAAIQTQIDTKTELIRAEHSADVKRLENSIGNVDSKYESEVTRINTELARLNSSLVQLERDYRNGNQELKEEIADLRLQQVTQQNMLTGLKETHERDVAAIQKELATAKAALQEKIDIAVADLRQDMLTLDNQYKDAVAELKNRISATDGKLENEVSKLSETDRDLYDKIFDLREKQADYYARMEILKITHEKDKEALEKEMADLDARYRSEVEAINGRIDSINGKIAELEAGHAEDVAALQREIDSTVSKLDEEVRKIYVELTVVKDELSAHRQATQEAIDDLLLRLAELDKSVTERLRNLENRIRYSVYADEKLEDLRKDFEKQIQAKEKEIADLDLKIQEMADRGLDTSAEEETRIRLLEELLKLRNELTDIEFAIEIRHNESEFAEHEKELALLKAELAALRQSSDLQIKQLRDELLAMEERYLKLLEEVRQEAAGQNSSLQKQLDDLTAKVLAFVDALRSERETGDAELKALLEAMDISHKELIANLDSGIADKLERLKFETDTQFENLRSTINNIAYQQRFSSGGSGTGYSLPSSQVQEVPNDSRDLRVSPDASLDAILN